MGPSYFYWYNLLLFIHRTVLMFLKLLESMLNMETCNMHLATKKIQRKWDLKPWYPNDVWKDWISILLGPIDVDRGARCQKFFNCWFEKRSFMASLQYGILELNANEIWFILSATMVLLRPLAIILEKCPGWALCRIWGTTPLSLMLVY